MHSHPGSHAFAAYASEALCVAIGPGATARLGCWAPGQLQHATSAGTAAWSCRAHPSWTAPLPYEELRRGSEFAPAGMMCSVFDLLPRMRWRAGSLRFGTLAVLSEQLAVRDVT